MIIRNRNVFAKLPISKFGWEEVVGVQYKNQSLRTVVKMWNMATKKDAIQKSIRPTSIKKCGLCGIYYASYDDFHEKHCYSCDKLIKD